MIYRLAADVVMFSHFLFVAFVVVGGALSLRWPRLAWFHIPAFCWGFLVAANRWVCPLTPLEQDLRSSGGDTAYEGGFIAHYIEPVLYPEGLPWGVKMVFAVILLTLNVLFWRLAWRKRRGATQGQAAHGTQYSGPEN